VPLVITRDRGTITPINRVIISKHLLIKDNREEMIRQGGLMEITPIIMSICIMVMDRGRMSPKEITIRQQQRRLRNMEGDNLPWISVPCLEQGDYLCLHHPRETLKCRCSIKIPRRYRH
jgi:hypothetical protein